MRLTLSCLVLAVLALLVLTPAGLTTSDCCDPNSPFVAGEDWPAQPATCETIAYWAERAPDTTDRISLAIRGKLAAVSSDGALAYLIMCDAPGMQVLCVTYETNDMKAGEVVFFGGGYARAGDKQVILDPCLASRD